MTVIQEVVGSTCYSLLCKHNGSKDGDSRWWTKMGMKFMQVWGAKLKVSLRLSLPRIVCRC